MERGGGPTSGTSTSSAAGDAAIKAAIDSMADPGHDEVCSPAFVMCTSSADVLSGEEDDNDNDGLASFADTDGASVASAATASSLRSSAASISGVSERIQGKYRESAARFFADKQNFDRLSRFFAHKDDDIAAIVEFFVVRSPRMVLVSTLSASDRATDTWRVWNILDQYERALRKYRKHFYSFRDRAGSGKVRWEGMTNPKIIVAAEHGSLSLPLAKLLAFKWFIEYGFDAVFWERFDKTKKKFTEYTTEVKVRYTSAHKKKKTALRKEVEQEMLRERAEKEKARAKRKAAAALLDDGGDGDDYYDSQDSGAESSLTGAKSKKPAHKSKRRKPKKHPVTRFNHEERRHIKELIEKRQLAQRAQARKARIKDNGRRKPTKKAQSGVYILSIQENEAKKARLMPF